jgi:hypothetical protein
MMMADQDWLTAGVYLLGLLGMTLWDQRLVRAIGPDARLGFDRTSRHRRLDA